MSSVCDFDFAIIGGGAAGVLLALRLLRDAGPGQRIALIEPGTPGQGIAYATSDAAHVLNVPAGGMSADADRPTDFVDFLSARDGTAAPTAFMPRRDYADYLATRLQEARAASAAGFQHIARRAVEVTSGSTQVDIHLDDGRSIAARHVALACGNQLRQMPAALQGPRSLPAWSGKALAQIGNDDDIAILGSGLSMVDVLLTLSARGHRGQVHVISRHGLLPLAHATQAQSLPFALQHFLSLPLRPRLRYLRQRAEEATRAGIGWQALMDALRPHVRLLWQTLDLADKRRFLRHVARYWDIHRHRIAPQVAAILAAQKLHLHAGRILACRPNAQQLLLEVQMRGGQGESSLLQVDWLVNATGIETRAKAFADPLRQRLLASGMAQPGPLGLGFAGNAEAALLDAAGRPQPRLALIGSLRLGDLWESIAIPDLRLDAAALAARWLAAAKAGR